LINTVECSYCGESYVKCEGCGEIMDFDDLEEQECSCGNTFEIKSEYIGSGMTEEKLYIRNSNYVRPEFIDPDQTSLFE
jgi:hypothetical protein